MKKYKVQIMEAVIIMAILGALTYMGTHEHILEAEPINLEIKY